MDEFSFPAVAVDPDSLCRLPFPHFAASPLWFLSSASDPKAARQRRSFSSAEDAYTQREDLASPAGSRLSSPALSDGGGGGGCGSRRFLENEEKMDMLWEDFNEELTRLSQHHQYRRQASKDSGAGRDAAAFPAAAGIGSKSSRKGSRRVKTEPLGSPALAMTKSNSLIHHRSPGTMVVLKLLKRLFLVQNPRSSRKTRHCDEQDPPAS